MTRSKKLKKTIRARARKTGESYTAARRQVLLSRRKPTAPAPPKPSAPKPAASTSRGALSEAAVQKRTGHGYRHWFQLLDAFGAATKGHTAAARHLAQEHGVPGWYAQGITVAYERARGLRQRNQASSGAFQVSVSRVLPVPVSEVAGALGDARRRAVWLKDADPELVRALDAAFEGEKPRRVIVKDASHSRLRYPWDGSVVEIHILAKPKGRASIVADNTKLRDGAHVERRRLQWRRALDALKAHLLT